MKIIHLNYTLREGPIGDAAFLFGAIPFIKCIDVEAEESLYFYSTVVIRYDEKMKNARSAYLIFLQSLPIDGNFNVYTHRYQFEVFNVGSVKYSNWNLTKVLNFVARAMRK